MRSMDEVLDELKVPFKPAELQLSDIQLAADSGRFLFAYEVGLGKTFVSTVVAAMWDSKHTIIVCPPILNLQWKYWLESVNQVDIGVYAGVKRGDVDLNHKWVIMSHSIFRNSFKSIHAFYKSKNVSVIVDEAHCLKSYSSKIYKYMTQFIGSNRNILMLTATPTSKPEDSYTYMKIKTPTLYNRFSDWDKMHVQSRDFFGAVESYKNLNSLADNFAIKSVKRSKQEVFGGILEPVYQTIPYELSSKHYKLYRRLAEEQLLMLPDGGKIDASTSQRLYFALQQIVVNFSKFSGDENDVSNTFDLINEVIDEVNPMETNNSKLVIWTYYVSSSKSITAYLKNKFSDKAVVAAYGGVDSKKSIDSIMNDTATRILVAQPSSCGVGLNLQHVCSENLFVEMSTSPMQIRQAIGRTDRVGQKVRPTMRFAQAVGTIQPELFNNLLNNDNLVSRVERTIKSLKQEIFGLN